MTLAQLQAELARCDLELLKIATDYPHTIYCYIGYADWEVEKQLIQREIVSMENIGKLITTAENAAASAVTERLTDAALRTESMDFNAIRSRLGNDTTLRLLHAAMGMCTESAEFLDMLKKHLFYGKPFDHTNAVEEIGDCTWYERIGCDALQVAYLDMIQRNVAKLRQRFPDKFTEHDALHRDVVAELRHVENRKYRHQADTYAEFTTLPCDPLNDPWPNEMPSQAKWEQWRMYDMLPGFYWVWRLGEWVPGKFDGNDWWVGGDQLNHAIPVGPKWTVPEKPTMPPTVTGVAK